MRLTRRLILKTGLLFAALFAALPFIRKELVIKGTLANKLIEPAKGVVNLGVDAEGFSHVFMARNGTPQQNVEKTINMIGGIEKLIGINDIVVLKPNAQWWNQGMTNTDAMQGFIDMVLAIPGFSGEVIVAENHQFDEDDSRGWTTEKRNGNFNLNELVEHYQTAGYPNVTKYHWRVAGKTDLPLEGNAQGSRRVTGPQDGDGYVWLEDKYYISPVGRKSIMTYPVFTSSYSGITIDLKNGAWKGGSWLKNRPVKFINFSALNHHGWYCGVTASVKNLMGVVDMSCGFQGNEPKGTYNTHFIGVSKLILLSRNKYFKRIRNSGKYWHHCYRNFHHTGGALGCFMRSVRMPDLNIITAEKVGWGSRTDETKSFTPKTILASKDPVALDYVAARDILMTGTPDSHKKHNDPDIKEGAFYSFLFHTHMQQIGNLDSNKIKVYVNDLSLKKVIS